MQTKDLYPVESRDTLDKIANCNAEYGADELHTVVPKAKSADAEAASPRATPKSPEGLG